MPNRLAMFLQDQRTALLADLQVGKGQGWEVVTGNEAGGESEGRMDTNGDGQTGEAL